VGKRFVFGSVFLAALMGVTLGVPPALASNDPGFKKQYGLTQIGAPSAWTKTAGNGITIAIVDSGVDLDHPDLQAKIVPGHDFGDNDDNPDDDSGLKDGEGKYIRGHGTHVAGIAAAITDNGVGVAGVAPYAKIMPLKVFASDPNSSFVNALTAVPTAIRYAVDHGAKVINLSLGGIQGLSLVGIIETPCAQAYSRGALCVVASGNSGQQNASGYQHDVQFLNVTANDDKGNHASFGQKADTQWSVSAPGVAVWSTYVPELQQEGQTDRGYAYEQGTSMAAPHATGLAALLFAQGLSVGQVVQKILTTATPMGDPGTNGAGRINAAAAVGAAQPTTATTVRQTVTTTATRSTSGFTRTTDDPFSGTHSTLGTVPSNAATDDNLAFSGGPGNPQLDPAAHRKPVQKVPLGTMFATLGVLAVAGGAWGGLSFARRRAPAQLPPA
jgi:subtilisin family serine protease